MEFDYFSPSIFNLINFYLIYLTSRLQFVLLRYQRKNTSLWLPFKTKQKKFRIQETKHLSTDADSSTDAIGGWTKNTQKPDFFLKNGKNHSKTQKLKDV